MELSKLIFELSEVCAPAGFEDSINDILVQKLRRYTGRVRRTNGGIIADIAYKNENLPKVVLDAHIDSVGLIVTGIEGSFLRVNGLGGIDARILAAQRVTIHGKDDVKGVICSVPPHLAKDKDKVRPVNEIFIDTCLSEERVKELISAGDAITYDAKGTYLHGTRITAPSLDDRCGAAAILSALDRINIEKLNCRLSVAFTRQEEVGLRGAAMAAYETDADIAIAVDVSFGLSGSEKPSECGQLGEGVMIGLSPVLDRELSDKLIALALKNDIPYQREVMSRTTSTNADRYTVSRGGAKGATLSVPLRYMHTPVEVIDLNDVSYTARLIAAYLSSFEVENNA